MVNAQQKKINKITYRVLMIIYGLTAQGAMHRLEVIRTSLGHKPKALLNVLHFCKAEGLTLDEFDTLVERAHAHLK